MVSYLFVSYNIAPYFNRHKKRDDLIAEKRSDMPILKSIIIVWHSSYQRTEKPVNRDHPDAILDKINICHFNNLITRGNLQSLSKIAQVL